MQVFRNGAAGLFGLFALLVDFLHAPVEQADAEAAKVVVWAEQGGGLGGEGCGRGFGFFEETCVV